VSLIKAIELETLFDFRWFLVVDREVLLQDEEMVGEAMDLATNDEFLWDSGLVNTHGLLQITAIPVQFGTLAVRFELHDVEPTIAVEDWDFVAEGYLSLPSGSVTVTHPPGLAPATTEVTVPVGTYTARVAGREYKEAAIEHRHPIPYTVWLWPADAREPRVLRSHRR
jgi:hypothetical protein